MELIASLKCKMPKGIPTMVTQKMRPHTAWTTHHIAPEGRQKAMVSTNYPTETSPL